MLIRLDKEEILSATVSDELFERTIIVEYTFWYTPEREAPICNDPSNSAYYDFGEDRELYLSDVIAYYGDIYLDDLADEIMSEYMSNTNFQSRLDAMCIDKYEQMDSENKYNLFEN